MAYELVARDDGLYAVGAYRESKGYEDFAFEIFVGTYKDCLALYRAIVNPEA